MIKFQVYILYSEYIGKYYVGYTGTPIEERIRKHLSSHKGFTAQAKDWKLVYSEPYETRSQAYKRELEVKRKKSRIYIEQLINGSG